jgi:type I restriction enzyme S subunit
MCSKPGDVLIVMTCQTPKGEILGIPGRVPNDGRTYLHNQRMGLVKIIDYQKVDLGFLYYLFLSSGFNAHLFGSATGAKILHTAPSRIENYHFCRPPPSLNARLPPSSPPTMT